MLHIWNQMYFMFLPSTKSKNKPKNIYDRVRSRKAKLSLSLPSQPLQWVGDNAETHSWAMC